MLGSATMDWEMRLSVYFIVACLNEFDFIKHWLCKNWLNDHRYCTQVNFRLLLKTTVILHVYAKSLSGINLLLVVRCCVWQWMVGCLHCCWSSYKGHWEGLLPITILSVATEILLLCIELKVCASIEERDQHLQLLRKHTIETFFPLPLLFFPKFSM